MVLSLFQLRLEFFTDPCIMSSSDLNAKEIKVKLVKLKPAVIDRDW